MINILKNLRGASLRERDYSQKQELLMLFNQSQLCGKVKQTLIRKASRTCLLKVSSIINTKKWERLTLFSANLVAKENIRLQLFIINPLRLYLTLTAFLNASGLSVLNVKSAS